MGRLRIVFAFLLGFGCATSGGQPVYPLSDHYNGKVFFNSWGVNNSKTLWDVLKWKLSGGPKEWPNEIIANTAVPQLVSEGKAASVHITFIGHATTYIQDAKLSILTDPIFSDRISPVGVGGPKRFRKPGVDLEQLPQVDLVVISHNHYDHMDLPSLRALNKKFKPKFIVPLGNAALLKSEGIENVIELDWWQSEGVVQLVPAQHWSARGIYDRNKTLWGGYMIHLPEKKIFFAGDTGYGPHFKMIRERVGSPDLAILPIGAYEPRSFMKDQHMNPEDAVQAHLDLEARRSFAMHFETFQLTDEGYEEPRNTLKVSLAKYGLSNPKDFFLPEFGETLILK